MKLLVDTSVWVDFFAGRGSPEALALRSYLHYSETDIVTCGVVIAEFFQGLRGSKWLAQLRARFLDMPLLSPREPETYFAAAELYRLLRRRGITVRSTIDCLIACLAAESGALLLARDRDLRLILQSGQCAAKAAPLVE